MVASALKKMCRAKISKSRSRLRGLRMSQRQIENLQIPKYILNSSISLNNRSNLLKTMITSITMINSKTSNLATKCLNSKSKNFQNISLSELRIQKAMHFLRLKMIKKITWKLRLRVTKRQLERNSLIKCKSQVHRKSQRKDCSSLIQRQRLERAHFQK